MSHQADSTPVFVATWPFGLPACERAVEVAINSGSVLDGIEYGIRLTEADLQVESVGIGGIPNADGVVELDACIMAGRGHRAGSVAGLQDIAHPISVARKVMETTPHVMLVGENAQRFAVKNGFEIKELLTETRKSDWLAWNRNQHELGLTENQHDTISMLGLDGEGNLWGGCSTSGWGYKIPGRVGDSPIIGSGLYIDNSVGAAAATGMGENVMRHCGSFLAVELMRGGATPEEACCQTIQRISEVDPRSVDQLDINFIAIRKDGLLGAAGSSRGFRYAVAMENYSELLEAPGLSQKMIGPEGGHRI